MKTTKLKELPKRIINNIIRDNQEHLIWENGETITRNELLSSFVLIAYEAGTYDLRHNKDDFFITNIVYDFLTKKEKSTIADIVLDKSKAVGNETIHVWKKVSENAFCITTGSMEYRDDDYQFLFSLKIINELRPYTKADILKQIDYVIH